jgi:tetratricopeptide (TPR) repeat protein
MPDTTLLPSSGLSGVSAQQLIHDGLVARESGDCPAAIAAFREAVTLDPSRAEAWLALGNALNETGDAASAEDAYWQAIDLKPSLLRQFHPPLGAFAPSTGNATSRGWPAALVDLIMPEMLGRLALAQPWRANLFIPGTETYAVAEAAPFMRYSTCSAADFLHPEFARIVGMIGRTMILHRKLWEWVYVVHHLMGAGVVGPGRRGLVFGVGNEMLPALFASHGAAITATDAPADIGEAWQSTEQFASGLAAMPEGALPREQFERLVSWEPCDMTAIPAHLTGYDFCWSSCCFEHLGSLRAGMDFVVNSVERCLAPGGVAVHTTELNLSSNDATVANGATVLYRRRDIEDLIAELRALGHEAAPFSIAPDTLTVDGFVDTPPYATPHLKLLLEGYVATSVGLVVRKRGS